MPGVLFSGQQVDAEGRVDRVDLAAAHRLNLGVRVGDDLEVDLLQARLLAVPEGVGLQRRALALGVVREHERAVRDGLAVAAADAVRPDLVEVLARERRRRIDTAEQELPRRIRLLPLERDLLLALVGVAGDLVVAVAADEVVLRIDDLLPRVDEVLVRDGDLLAAPVPVRVLADRVGERRLRRRSEETRSLTFWSLSFVMNAPRMTGTRLDAGPELVAARQVRVEARRCPAPGRRRDVLRLASSRASAAPAPRTGRRARRPTRRPAPCWRPWSSRLRWPPEADGGCRARDEPEAITHRCNPPWMLTRCTRGRAQDRRGLPDC